MSYHHKTGITLVDLHGVKGLLRIPGRIDEGLARQIVRAVGITENIREIIHSWAEDPVFPPVTMEVRNGKLLKYPDLDFVQGIQQPLELQVGGHIQLSIEF